MSSEASLSSSEQTPAPVRARGISLADGLALAGFVGLLGGVAIQFGPGWMLVVGGGLSLGIGLVAAWRRSG